jgi:hypothetical protein
VKLLPVIHVTDEKQALEQAEIATKAGADGIWLINHEIDATDLWRIFTAVRQHDPGQWIGLNFLDLSPLEAMHQVTDMVDGLWCDDGGIRESGPTPQAEAVWRLKQSKDWKGQLFGGVAFKGQREVRDPALAAKNAAPVMDVVTTSGPATGVAAPIDKIRWMSTEAPHLGIASGITAQNVVEYLPWVEYFLVATGISRDFHHLDPDLTAALAGIIHGFEELAEGMADPVRRASEPPEGPDGV